MKTMSRSGLLSVFDQEFKPLLFKDYAPNGLQVEGSDEIKKIVCGVTASQSLIDLAIEQEADSIFVHHGYFWRGENQAILGYKARRIKSLLANNINLFAYHLPLDAHPSLGNNWRLGQLLGIQTVHVIKNGRQKKLETANTQLCFIGDINPVTADVFAKHVEHTLGRAPLLIQGDSDRLIKKVAWCTGGAQVYFAQAIQAGADIFITGEVSERTYHEAKETGVHFLSAGHHATERYGPKAVAQWLLQEHGLTALFIDVDNPV